MAIRKLDRRRSRGRRVLLYKYVITLDNKRTLRGYSRLFDPRSEKPIDPRRRSSQGKEGALEKREGDGGSDSDDDAPPTRTRK